MDWVNVASKRRLVYRVGPETPPEVRDFCVAHCAGYVDQEDGGVLMETAPLVYERLLSEFGPRRLHDQVTSIYEARLRRRKRLQDALQQTYKPDWPLFNSLREHQVTGANFLAKAVRGLCLDQVGTGKTWLALYGLHQLWATSGVSKVLVVCPKSARYGWEKQAKALIPDWPLFIPEGGVDIRLDALDRIPNKSITVMNWDMLSPRIIRVADDTDSAQIRKAQASKERAALWEKRLKQQGYHLIIADEVHRAKHRDAHQTTALHKISPHVDYLWGLSATPTNGQAREWWSILKLMDPGRFTSYWRWDAMFTDSTPNWDGRFSIVNKKNGYNGNKNVDIFHDVLADYCLARPPGPGIPSRRYKRVYVDLLPRQRAAYNDIKRDFVTRLSNGEDLFASGPLAQSMRLRQIAVNPMLIGGVDESAKIEALTDILTDLDPALNVVVYSGFVNSPGTDDGFFLAHIERAIKRALNKKYEIRRVWGATPADERTQTEDWLNEKKGRLLLLATAAGREALNYQGAQIGIYLDRPWSWTASEQSEGRIARLGQEKDFVLYYDIVANDTLDEHVLDVLGMAGQFNESTFAALVVQRMLAREN